MQKQLKNMVPKYCKQGFSILLQNKNKEDFCHFVEKFSQRSNPYVEKRSVKDRWIIFWCGKIYDVFLLCIKYNIIIQANIYFYLFKKTTKTWCVLSWILCPILKNMRFIPKKNNTVLTTLYCIKKICLFV